MADIKVDPPGIFPAPPGVTPNFDHPIQRTDGLIPLIAIFVPLSTIFLALRLYTKAKIIKILGWEDVFVTLGWMFTIGLVASFLSEYSIEAYGIHTWDMTIAKYPKVAKIVAAAVILYVPAVALPKISICLFYLRLNPARSFRYAVFATIFLISGYMISLVLALLFPCKPVRKLWDPYVEGHCIDRNPIYVANVIIQTVNDVLVFILPLPMVMNLQVNTRTKIALASIFAISSCTIVLSAVRIWALVSNLNATDFFWSASPSTSIIICEINLTIICSSVLVLRPFCRHHLPWLLGGTGRSAPPYEDRSPAPADALAHFDGPMGPRSKSGYLTEVSAGPKGASSGGGGTNDGGGGGAYKKRHLHPGKKNGSFWGSFSNTLVGDDDDEDLENLSTELSMFPNSERKTLENVEKPRPSDDRATPVGSETSWLADGGDAIGIAKGGEKGDVERGIVKTVSLNVQRDEGRGR